MIRVGIIGGAGYTAGELIRILVNHSEAEVATVLSTSHAGKKLIEAHPDLIGEKEMVFEAELSEEVDILFLCSGHGKSKPFLDENKVSDKTKIIDLSNDFRLKESGQSFVYGLPELNRDEISSASKIANPGCFATCIQLCLLPLAKHNCMKEDIHVSAITGSTGAGQSLSETTHFSWRSNNASMYKAFTHQHLGEINQSINQLQPGFKNSIHFIPFRGAFTRGILAACYLKSDLDVGEAQQLFREFYRPHLFVQLSENPVDVKQVVNTNKAILHLQKEGDQLLITGVIDNLIKGASGQAIQNMNLLFGLDESTGLNLKGGVF